MTKYIDRDKFMQNLEADKYGHTDCARVGAALDKAVADVVEVVRCKDCSYRRPIDEKQFTYNSEQAMYCVKHSRLCNDTDFCNFAERK